MIDSPAVRSRVMAEPHSDPGGFAVVWGASHKTSSAADCCKACAEHAANPKNKKRPCNSWVFCNTSPQCWSLDTGNWHGFGECWLKWQADPTHPLYGQRGRFTADFRKKHANAHKTGKNPDGTPRNLSVPTHVPWTGGIMGTTVDRSVQWETGLDGMRSSNGDSVSSRGPSPRTRALLPSPPPLLAHQSSARVPRREDGAVASVGDTGAEPGTRSQARVNGLGMGRQVTVAAAVLHCAARHDTLFDDGTAMAYSHSARHVHAHSGAP